MTNQQLKDTIQAALQALPVGGPAGTLDEVIAGVSKRGPSGTYHAGNSRGTDTILRRSAESCRSCLPYWRAIRSYWDSGADRET